MKVTGGTLLEEEAAAGIREAHIRAVRLLLRTKGSCSPQLASPGAAPMCTALFSGAWGFSPQHTFTEPSRAS